MRKKTILMNRLATVLAVIAVMVLATVSASAYGYELSVSPGNGQLDGKQEIISVTGGSGDDMTASAETRGTTVTLGGVSHNVTQMPDGKAPSDSKYFVRGLKLAGEDNDLVFDGPINIFPEEGSGSGSEIVNKYKHKDTELVVAYGLKSDMVAYTISYVNAATGENLIQTETHYGTIGSDPVVSYKYVDGFLPNAYAATRKLTANAADNVFTFWYYQLDAQGNVVTITDLVPGAPAAPAGPGAGAGAGAANAGDGTATIGDNATPRADGPADVVDLDDSDTPKADDPDGDKAGLNWPMIAGIGGLIALLAALAAYFAKRRSEEDEEDDEDEDEEEEKQE